MILLADRRGLKQAKGAILIVRETCQKHAKSAMNEGTRKPAINPPNPSLPTCSRGCESAHEGLKRLMETGHKPAKPAIAAGTMGQLWDIIGTSRRKDFPVSAPLAFSAVKIF